jgi:geranylgeranyl pyrophosphate synthase
LKCQKNSPEITSYLKEVREKIKSTLAEDSFYTQKINRYIFSSLGKMIRPSLVYLSARLFSPLEKEKEIIVALGAVVEMVHLATLIHDDIIDKATLRRGKPSVNQKWGGEIAILIGDCLFAKAFYLLSQYFKGEILQILSQTVRLICEGEIEQVRLRFNSHLSEKKYLEIIKNKTGLLMSACCQTAALAINPSAKDKIFLLQQCGLNLGLAFQIVDDCLDLVGQENKLKKNLRVDLENGEITLPLIYFRKKIFKQLSSQNKDQFYQKLTASWESQKESRKEALKYAIKKAEQYVIQAKKNIAPFQESFAKSKLLTLSDEIIERILVDKKAKIS